MRNQTGQVLVFGLAGLLLVAVTLVLLYNAGQTSSEKIRAVNAADAAAYSGGIWVARQLNFMAYTNRAMIANHVAVGHFISYMSWIRYVEDSSETIRDLTRFIPYVNIATEILATWADYVSEGTEYFAELFVPATDLLNRSMHAAQVEAKFNMLGVLGAGPLAPMHEIMDRTVKKYHLRLRVNHPDDLATLTGAVTGVQIVSELMRLYAVTERFDASNDEGRIKALVEDSLLTSRDWVLGNRGWQECLLISCALIPSNMKAVKTGSTEQTQSDAKLGWKAEDELGFWKAKKKRWWSSYRWSGGTIADGDATAEEFDSEYAGIYGYYALTTEDGADVSFFVSAYTTLPAEAVQMKPLLRMDVAEPRLSALARAEIFYQPPAKQVPAEQYSNLFNPYWRARLTSYKPFFVF